MSKSKNKGFKVLSSIDEYEQKRSIQKPELLKKNVETTKKPIVSSATAKPIRKPVVESVKDSTANINDDSILEHDINNLPGFEPLYKEPEKPIIKFKGDNDDIYVIESQTKAKEEKAPKSNLQERKDLLKDFFNDDEREDFVVTGDESSIQDLGPKDKRKAFVKEKKRLEKDSKKNKSLTITKGSNSFTFNKKHYKHIDDFLSYLNSNYIGIQKIAPKLIKSKSFHKWLYKYYIDYSRVSEKWSLLTGEQIDIRKK